MLVNLSKRKFQVLLLYSTTLVGVLMGVLSSIVNTHFIDPETYGNVRYIQNILNFTSSLLLLGFFQSGSRLLAVSNTITESRRIKGCMVLLLGITILIQIACCIFLGFINLEKVDIAHLFWISIPVCASPILVNYVNMTAQGDNHIVRLSFARLLPSLLYVPIAYFIYRYFGANATKMILLQWGFSTLILIIIVATTRPVFTDLKDSWILLKKENHQYGFQLYIGSIVMVATNYIAGISLGLFNDNNIEVGFYTLALTVTSPLATLPAIIGTTYFKEFATQSKIPDKVMKMTILVTTVTCICFIICIKPLVDFLYSERYASVGQYAIILSIGFCLHGFGDMINRYLGSQGQGKSIRNASIANGIFKIVGFTVLVYFFDIFGALITVILCDVIYLMVLLYYYFKFVKSVVK